MDTSTPYSFRMVRTSYKSQDLVYEEVGHKLIIYLEVAAVRKYDWIGGDTALGKWTEPKEEKIPEDRRAKILRRLSAWSQEEKVRIGFGPPLDMEKMASDFQKKGWSVEKREGGVTAFKSPTKRGILAQIGSMFRKRKKDA